MNSEKTDRPGYRASVRRIQTVLYNLSQTDLQLLVKWFAERGR